MARVTGSIARRTTFWAHLACGVTAGLLILLMSVTGVLLTYEKQMVGWVAGRNHLAAVPASAPLSADRLAAAARAVNPQAARGALVFDADPTAPVTVSLGRQGTVLLNPYTGMVIDDASAGLRGLFRTLENWHRWLGGSPNGLGARLIDIGNLLFLFIVISGIYLWLPAVWKWPILRGLMFFRRRYINSKVRDFNWHHVFSCWALIPLFLVVLSGVVMSFQWANQLVYAAYGETAPQRRGSPGGEPGGGPPAAAPAVGAPQPGGPGRASLDALLLAARGRIANWQTLSLPMAGSAGTVSITAELQSAAARAPRQTLTLNAADASVLEVSEPQGMGTRTASRGQRARIWFRFVHTGEAYGVLGQTLAGLASLAACFLVYTGLALAYRRLIAPVFRRP